MKRLDALLLAGLVVLWAGAKVHFFTRFGATTFDGYIDEHWSLWAGMAVIALLLIAVGVFNHRDTKDEQSGPSRRSRREMIRDAWRRLTSWASGRRQALQSGHPKPRFIIAFDPEGFGLASLAKGHETSALRVEWSDIRKVGVLKRDLYVVDMVCLVVELPGPRTVEVNEEMQGWQPFIEALPRFLPGTKPWHEWFLEVAFPAFEAKPTLIFSR